MSGQKDVLVVMGSKSDWPTMKLACDIFDKFEVTYDALIVSAHRTPERLARVAKSAHDDGFKVIIAGAGGAAHLPGMMASFSRVLPVLGVPVKSSTMSGLDSLYSIVQMPAEVPVGTLAIGEAGAKNAAYLAIQILGLSNRELQKAYADHRDDLTDSIPVRPE